MLSLLVPATEAAAQRFVLSAESPNRPSVFVGDAVSGALTALQQDAFEATISPDGQQVAYVDGPDLRDLSVEPTDGGEHRILRKVEKGANAWRTTLFDPAFSPDGKKLAVGCRNIYLTPPARRGAPDEEPERSDCLGNVEEVDVDAGGGTLLTNAAQSVRYVDDGEGVVYSGVWDNELFEMDRDGDGNAPLPAMAAVFDAREPVVSPDGTQLAFSGRSEQFGTWKIYLLDLGDQQVEALTQDEGRRPTWAPDGQSVAYVNETGAQQVNVATGAQTTLVANGFESDGDTYNRVTSIAFPQPRTFDNVAQRFRPNLYFDTSGRFRPLNIASFFRERDPLGSPLHRGCRSGTCAGLADSNSLRSFPGGDYIEVGQVDGEYVSPDPECADDDRVDCTEGPAATAYYNATENDTDGYSYVDYWYFYRYNDFDGGTQHEGDWESVTLAFSLGAESSLFDYAQFSQHGTWFRYLRGALQCDGRGDGSCGTEESRRGQRLTVYVANGSHANYPDACSPVPLFGCSQADGGDETGHDGEHPWGENGRGRLTSLARFPVAGGWGTGDPKNWTDWPGIWGSPAGGPLTNPGPPSPGNQPHYEDPGNFRCADNTGSECTNPNRAAGDDRGPATVTDQRCEPWFGAMVVAAICDGEAVAAAHQRRTLGQAGAFGLEVAGTKGVRHDSAPGIAQAVGEPLRIGNRIKVTGNPTRRARLHLRAQRGKKLFELAVTSVPAGRWLEVAEDGATPALRTLGGTRLPTSKVVTRVVQ